MGVMTTTREDITVLGQGVYGGAEALRLVNFRNAPPTAGRGPVSRQTIARWMRGYDFEVDGKTCHSEPLWQMDYPDKGDDRLELSFRDLIELRFVKAFRDAGVGLTAIRRCLQRATEWVDDARPFSTRKFKTDGRTIFMDVTRDVEDDALIDLAQRQAVFRSFVLPSLKDLEFDADSVARWFPLGMSCRSVVVDPAYAFGRPVTSEAHVPTEILSQAVDVEGSAERVARLYDVSLVAVRDAIAFESQLAA